MKRPMLAVSVFAVITSMLADTDKRGIIAFTPLQVRWFTPSYYTDGRERAQLLGDSSQGGMWIDRVNMPAGKRVLAHTHPQDELASDRIGYPSEHEAEQQGAPTRQHDD